MKSRSLLGVACVLLCSCGGAEEEAACRGASVRVVRPGASAPLVSVCAQVARTEAERTQGLSGRSRLAASEGLLLEFPVEGEACIVNGPVTFGIDVVFANDRGDVVALERAVAAGDATPRCHPGVRRVLEIAEGVADSVAVGDTLRID